MDNRYPMISGERKNSAIPSDITIGFGVVSRNELIIVPRPCKIYTRQEHIKYEKNDIKRPAYYCYII